MNLYYRLKCLAFLLIGFTLVAQGGPQWASIFAFIMGGYCAFLARLSEQGDLS